MKVHDHSSGMVDVHDKQDSERNQVVIINETS